MIEQDDAKEDSVVGKRAEEEGKYDLVIKSAIVVTKRSFFNRFFSIFLTQPTDNLYAVLPIPYHCNLLGNDFSLLLTLFLEPSRRK